MFFAKICSTVLLGFGGIVAYYYGWIWTARLTVFAALVIWAGPFSLEFSGLSAEQRKQNRCVEKVQFND